MKCYLRKLQTKAFIFPLIIVILILTIEINNKSQMCFAEESIKDTVNEKNPKYVPENIRARLTEARKCISDKPGNSWSECRYNCVETCNEIADTYSRGVCNGVLIQICCGQHPTGCK